MLRDRARALRRDDGGNFAAVVIRHHLDALAQQIDTLDHDLQEYRKAALGAADSCSLTAAVDACQMLRTRLEAERSALMAEQEVDLMELEPRVPLRAPEAGQPPVPAAVAAPAQRPPRGCEAGVSAE